MGSLMQLPSLLIFIASLSVTAPFANDGDKVSLTDLAQRGVQQSSLTSPDGKPFHLRATLAEAREPGSDYQAEIEEYCFLAANTALGRWIFRPHIKDGKPQYFHADIIFHMQ